LIYRDEPWFFAVMLRLFVVPVLYDPLPRAAG
jgi:hypothetical protein